jgi:hypothetical protein
MQLKSVEIKLGIVDEVKALADEYAKIEQAQSKLIAQYIQLVQKAVVNCDKRISLSDKFKAIAKQLGDDSIIKKIDAIDQVATQDYYKQSDKMAKAQSIK